MESLRFRPIEDSDLDFLRELYASTRTSELAQILWSEDQKQDFLDQQFQAQHQFYQQQFSQAQFELILSSETPVGRLYVDEREDEFRLIDIALLPEYCGQGIGGSLLAQILEHARRKNKSVRIHVEQYNPAMHLYKRLGFCQIDSNGIYDLMEWKDDEQGGSQ